MPFNTVLYHHKSRSIIALSLFIVLSLVSFFAIDYAFKEKVNEYIIHNVKNIFHKQGDTVAKYAILAPGLLGDRVNDILQNPFIARIIVKKNGDTVLYDTAKNNIENTSPLFPAITVYQSSSLSGDRISIEVIPYNPLHSLSKTLIFLAVLFMLLSGVIISTLFYFLFGGPMIKQFGRISRFTKSFRNIYRSFSDKTHHEFRNRVIDLSREYISDKPRYDFEKNADNIIRTINTLSEDLEQCIIQKEEISRNLIDSISRIEQAQQSITRFSHDINHPISHIEILTKNILNNLASTDLKRAYLSVLDLLITASLAGIKPRAFLLTEKLLSSSAPASDITYTDPLPTYIVLSEHFQLPLMILYANRMYRKDIDLRIDDDLLLNTSISIPHPQVIQSVFYNLITNALTYGGNSRIAVHISSYMVGSQKFLKVDVDGITNPLPDDVIEKVMVNDDNDQFIKSTSKELGGFGLILTKKALEHLGGKLVLTPGSASTRFEFPVKIEKFRSSPLTNQQIYIVGTPAAQDISLFNLFMVLKDQIALSATMVDVLSAIHNRFDSETLYVFERKILETIRVTATQNNFVYVTFSYEEYFSLRDTLPHNISIICPYFGFLELITGVGNLDRVASAYPSPPESVPSLLKGKRILILDDQPAFAEAMIDLLKTVLPAVHFDYTTTLSEALDLICNAGSSYDAFIIDMMLDGDQIGGVSAATQIRQALSDSDSESNKKPLFFAISAGKSMLSHAHNTGFWDGIYQKSQSSTHGLIAMANDIKHLLLAQQPHLTSDKKGEHMSDVKNKTFEDTTTDSMVLAFVSTVGEVLPHKSEDVFQSIDDLIEHYLNSNTNVETSSSLHKLAGKLMLFNEDLGERIESISQKFINNETIKSEDISFIEQFINKWSEFRRSGFI